MSLAIEVELLTGRYTATCYNDRNEVEWPPHPARLFSAMVAAWAEADAPDGGERAALEWLESIGAPTLTCSNASSRLVVTHYVPDNDPTALSRDTSRNYELLREAEIELQAAQPAAVDPSQPAGRRLVKAHRTLERARAKAAGDAAKAAAASGKETPKVGGQVLEVLPDRRGRQGRTYPTAIPDSHRVWFSWPDAALAALDDATRQALDRLLGRVARLGHSSSFVSCRLAVGPEEPSLVPVARAPRTSDVVLRVPRRGLLRQLEREFESHQGREPRTLPAGTAVYAPVGPRPPEPPRSLLAGEWVVFALPPRHRFALSRALELTRAVRGALVKHAEQPPAEVLTGHQPGGDRPTAPSERPHVGVLPLANVGHPHGDGALLGVAVAMPLQIERSERGAVLTALARWRAANQYQLTLRQQPGGSPSAFGLDPEADARRTLDRSYWSRSARRWVSVTPIALDHFPGPLASWDTQARARAEEEAKEFIARSCPRVGLPAPSEVELSFAGLLRGVPPVQTGARRHGLGRRPRRPGSSFPGYRTGGTKEPRVCIHAEIVFSEPVSGPLVLGAGRYLGYGLCFPIPGRGQG